MDNEVIGNLGAQYHRRAGFARLPSCSYFLLPTSYFLPPGFVPLNKNGPPLLAGRLFFSSNRLWLTPPTLSLRPAPPPVLSPMP